jgi:predicted nucleotidyltransferase
MNIFQDEHLEILKVLNKYKVNFILIGGVAVNYYGYSRPTGDLDVWLEPTDNNKKKLVKALVELNIMDEDIETINSTDFNDSVVFHIGTTPPFVIDFLTKIVGVKWAEAWAMKISEVVEGISISFLHINHLKANKLIAGRPKDHEDIRQLNRIEELRKNK